jgi:hypothetical protein
LWWLFSGNGPIPHLLMFGVAQGNWGLQPCAPHKVKWSAEEDESLLRAVRKNGTSSWIRIAALVPGRTSKQCRERWLGQLSPSVIKSVWSTEEDSLLLAGHAIHGNKWTIIGQALPGRSTISVKNRWSWLMRHGIPQRYHPRPLPPTTAVVRSDDVTERSPKASSFVLDALLVQGDLFGAHFREFQAKMLGDYSP